MTGSFVNVLATSQLISFQSSTQSLYFCYHFFSFLLSFPYVHLVVFLTELMFFH